MHRLAMRKVILLLLCASLSMRIQAQVLKGKVIDAASGEPLVGAAIGESSTGNGCATDFEGAFELTLSGIPASVK